MTIISINFGGFVSIVFTIQTLIDLFQFTKKNTNVLIQIHLIRHYHSMCKHRLFFLRVQINVLPSLDEKTVNIYIMCISSVVCTRGHVCLSTRRIHWCTSSFQVFVSVCLIKSINSISDLNACVPLLGNYTKIRSANRIQHLFEFLTFFPRHLAGVFSPRFKSNTKTPFILSHLIIAVFPFTSN